MPKYSLTVTIVAKLIHSELALNPGTVGKGESA